MTRFVGLLMALAFVTFALPATASEVTGTVHTGVSTGLGASVATTPTASPTPGTFTSEQGVTLTAAGADSIRYTTDGSTPTCASGTLYSGAIIVATSLTIRAVACYGNATSAVGIFAYGIDIPDAPSGGGGGGSSGGGSVLGASTNTGDIDGNGSIDLLDFNALITTWGDTGSSLAADLNHDGVVDLLDFNTLMANWTG